MAETNYDVHLYAVVRVKVCNVKAESMEAAIEKATSSVDIRDALDLGGGVDRTEGECEVAHAEFSDEIAYASVDVVGDEDYSQSCIFHADRDRWRSGSYPRALVIVSGGVADWVADGGVDVEVFDWDNYNNDPEGTGGVPRVFADLAEMVGIPVQSPPETNES